jgi:hypothetical protein
MAELDLGIGGSIVIFLLRQGDARAGEHRRSRYAA